MPISGAGVGGPLSLIYLLTRALRTRTTSTVVMHEPPLTIEPGETLTLCSRCGAPTPERGWCTECQISGHRAMVRMAGPQTWQRGRDWAAECGASPIEGRLRKVFNRCTSADGRIRLATRLARLCRRVNHANDRRVVPEIVVWGNRWEVRTPTDLDESAEIGVNLTMSLRTASCPYAMLGPPGSVVEASPRRPGAPPASATRAPRVAADLFTPIA